MSLVSKLSARWRTQYHGIRGRHRRLLSPTSNFLELAYWIILERRVDPPGLASWGERLDRGETSRHRIIWEMVESDEFRALHRRYQTGDERDREQLLSLHSSRVQVIKQLPKAERIVDLGGSWHSRPEGALVVMGYPYRFQSLSVVELPRERRHDLYAEVCGHYPDAIPTPLGPVSYVYTSMTDLSAFADESIDLVYSGQSIEHVTRDEARTVFRQVRRVLSPGGHLCLDTPNRAVTALQAEGAFINPDHKHEYYHEELAGILEDEGFAIREAKGLNLAARCVATRSFIHEEITDNPGLYDAIECCYLLYYKCQKV